MDRPSVVSSTVALQASPSIPPTYRHSSTRESLGNRASPPSGASRTKSKFSLACSRIRTARKSRPAHRLRSKSATSIRNPRTTATSPPSTGPATPILPTTRSTAFATIAAAVARPRARRRSRVAAGAIARKDFARHHGARRAGADGTAPGRSRALGLGRGRQQSVLLVPTRCRRFSSSPISMAFAKAARRSAR
jgi:hypothetical protein